MHKITIAKAQTDRLQMRLGKLHPFDVIDPRKTALVVVDMQNYFVKQGHQSEVPAAREIVPNINRLAAELRRRGGHVVWVRNGTNDTRESWSNYHNYLQNRDRAERRLQSMDIGGDGYEFWHLNDMRPEDAQITKKRYSPSSRARLTSSVTCASAASTRCLSPAPPPMCAARARRATP